MASISIACEYCGKCYSNRPNLLRHQRTVASCIRLQNNGEYQGFLCTFCKKSYSDKSNFVRHESNCPSKREYTLLKNIKKYKKKEKEFEQITEELYQLIKEKDEEIAALKVLCESNKVEVYDKVCTKVLDKPTVNNTSNTMNIHPKLVNLPITNIHPLTSDYVKEQVDNDSYTFDHYLKGENGLVDFIYSITMCENDDGELERSYVCTDPSRDSYHRLVETKEWQKDKGGKFVDVILDTLSDRVDNYHQKMFGERLESNSRYSGTSKTRRNLGYDPDYIYKLNNDMHSGVVQTHGKDRRTLRQRIKKETSRKITV
jgi:hypothetical protein